MTLRPDWNIELHASPEVLRASFGTLGEPWMRPLSGSTYLHRARWEFGRLPQMLRSDPSLLVWAPFGPPANLALAPRTVWMSRNIIPLLPMRMWEVSRADMMRVLALRGNLMLWARTARKTIAVSKDAQMRLARLARVAPDSIPVIPHGVGPAPTSTPVGERRHESVRRQPYLLHVGQPTAYRRTRELFQAYARLADERPDLPPLLAAGTARRVDASYERTCTDLLESAVLRGQAHLLGQISHSEVMDLMAEAHAFLYPSVHENCPNVVLEALGAGRVGVYSDIPTIRELAGGAGIFVPTPSAENLAPAIVRASFDLQLRADVSREARLRAALFSWERTANLTAAALDAAFAVNPGDGRTP